MKTGQMLSTDAHRQLLAWDMSGCASLPVVPVTKGPALCGVRIYIISLHRSLEKAKANSHCRETLSNTASENSEKTWKQQIVTVELNEGMLARGKLIHNFNLTGHITLRK